MKNKSINKSLTIFAAILSAFLLQVVTTHAASFDCARASSNIEKTICKNKWLGKLDEELSYYYLKLRKTLKPDAKSELAKEQRQWLKKRDKQCGTASCIGELYKIRINQLKIQYEKSFLPSARILTTICSELAALDAKGRIEYGSSDGINDINNDGLHEKPVKCYGGTLRVPCIEYYLPDGEKLNIQTINFEWKTYWTYGLRQFRKNGFIFRFHAYDDRFEKPAYLSFVTPENNEYVLGEFENKTTQKFIPEPDNPGASEICSLIQQGDARKIAYITLPEAPTISYQELMILQRYDTDLKRQGFLDYDNDGIPNLIGELHYASGAGRGCDFNYFDELAGDKKSFLQSPSRKLLLDMQKVNLSARHPNCGGMKNRFFIHKDTVYYELNTSEAHRILHIKDGRIQNIGSARQIVTTTVKSLGVQGDFLPVQKTKEPPSPYPKARSSVEKRIETSPYATLKKINAQVLKWYSIALKQAKDPEALKTEQRTWLETLDTCMTSEAVSPTQYACDHVQDATQKDLCYRDFCLVKKYNERIKELYLLPTKDKPGNYISNEYWSSGYRNRVNKIKEKNRNLCLAVQKKFSQYGPFLNPLSTHLPITELAKDTRVSWIKPANNDVFQTALNLEMAIRTTRRHDATAIHHDNFQKRLKNRIENKEIDISLSEETIGKTDKVLKYQRWRKGSQGDPSDRYQQTEYFVITNNDLSNAHYISAYDPFVIQNQIYFALNHQENWIYDGKNWQSFPVPVSMFSIYKFEKNPPEYSSLEQICLLCFSKE